MYKRVLLKLSGEILGGPEGKGLEPEYLRKYAHEIAQAAKAGLQIGVVNIIANKGWLPVLPILNGHF